MSKKVYSTETQFLTIQVILGHGINSQSLICKIDEDADDLAFQRAGLRKLVLVCLTVPAFSIHAKKLFVINDAAPSVSTFLHEHWTNSKDQFAVPQELEIKPIVAGIDQGLLKWIESNGVRVVIDSINNKKSLTAFEKAARKISFEMYWPDFEAEDMPRHIEKANMSLNTYRNDTQGMSHSFKTSMEYCSYVAFVNRENKRFHCSEPCKAPDVNLSLLQTRRSTAPPKATRAENTTESDGPLCPEGVKAIAECWPLGKADLRDRLSMNARELEWFLSGKSIIPWFKYRDLCRIFNVDIQFEYEQSRGGLILNANGSKNVDAVLNELTHGGDSAVFIEIENVQEICLDKRIYLFWSCGGIPNVLLVSRGSKEEAFIDGKDWLYNFQGKAIVPKGVCNTIKDCLERPESFVVAGKFGEYVIKKHLQYLEDAEDKARF